MQHDDLSVRSPAMVTAAKPSPALRRTLGLALLVLYGLGVTVGAGIYVMVGTAAGRAGVHAPVAFLIAAAVMAVSAASFAELAVRFPVSSGEAAYVQAGFKSRRLALLVGLLVLTAGIVSAAAISRGASGYLGVFMDAPPAVLVACVVLVMGAFAAWGIREAVSLAAIMTLIEISGLLVIVGAGIWAKPGILAELPQAFAGLGERAPWPGILGASLVAFFAFIGFEGMVNVAEEVRRPERTLPLAIGLTLGLTTLVYVLVIWVVIWSVPAPELAASPAPLGLAFERLTGASPLIIAAIAVFATVNGVIVQMVMASRVLYGLARQQVLPDWLAHVNEATRTPLNATAVVVAATLLLAVAFPLDSLADMTTRVMLVIFGLVNASLLALKWRAEPANGGFTVPIWVPVLGVLSCAGLLVADLLR